MEKEFKDLFVVDLGDGVKEKSVSDETKIVGTSEISKEDLFKVRDIDYSSGYISLLGVGKVEVEEDE